MAKPTLIVHLHPCLGDRHHIAADEILAESLSLTGILADCMSFADIRVCDATAAQRDLLDAGGIVYLETTRHAGDADAHLHILASHRHDPDWPASLLRKAKEAIHTCQVISRPSNRLSASDVKTILVDGTRPSHLVVMPCRENLEQSLKLIDCCRITESEHATPTSATSPRPLDIRLPRQRLQQAIPLTEIQHVFFVASTTSSESIGTHPVRRAIILGGGVIDKTLCQKWTRFADACEADLLQTQKMAQREWVDVPLIGISGQQRLDHDIALCVGVSGAIHHRVALQGAGILLAVNCNPKAPIHEIADYFCTGDAAELTGLWQDKVER